MKRSSIGVIQTGIQYQIRFFWLQALSMLNEDNIEAVHLERSEADGVDDINVFYKGSGKPDGKGGLVVADFYQAKYHVDNRSVLNLSYFTEENDKKKPLLKRFAETWKDQSVDYPECRITFVTTNTWDSNDPMIKFIEEDGYISEKFFTGGHRSSAGKLRAQCIKVTGLDEQSFNKFMRRVRFHFSWNGPFVEDALRDKMLLAQIKVPLIDQEANILDSLGQVFLTTGRHVWSKEKLHQKLKDEGVFSENNKPTPRVSVRSFSRAAGLDLTSGVVDIDLTRLFNGRYPIDSNVWGEVIPQFLFDNIPNIVQLSQPIELALDCHISIAWHLGLLLDSKSGVQTLLRQKSNNKGVELWDTSSGNGYDEWDVDIVDGDLDELIVSVSLTHDVKNDVVASLPSLGLAGGKQVHLSQKMASNSFVTDGAHALRLVNGLVDELKKITADHRPKKTHLFISSPVSFAFLLGQSSGVLGPSILYEYDFKASRKYTPGMHSTLV